MLVWILVLLLRGLLLLIRHQNFLDGLGSQDLSSIGDSTRIVAGESSGISILTFTQNEYISMGLSPICRYTTPEPPQHLNLGSLDVSQSTHDRYTWLMSYFYYRLIRFEAFFLPSVRTGSPKFNNRSSPTMNGFPSE